MDLNRIGHKDDPFIMATQSKQVFYINDPLDARWSIVLANKVKGYHTKGVDEDDNEALVSHEIYSKWISMESMIEDILDGENSYLRDDDEGVWIDNKGKKTT